MTRVGIGGSTYKPWRGTFTPKTFRQWFDETPDDFIFSLKAPRFAVNRRILGEAGPSITKFLESSVNELKSNLVATPSFKKYDAGVIEAFLNFLP